MLAQETFAAQSLRGSIDMRTIEYFLSYLYSLGVKIWIEGDGLCCNAPKGKLTPGLRDQLAKRKTEILKFIHQANVTSHNTHKYIRSHQQDTGVHQLFQATEIVDCTLDKPPSFFQEARLRLYQFETDVSFTQERKWLEQNSPYVKYARVESAYSRLGLLTALQFEGELNPQALEKSFNAVICRHEALRTTFKWVGNQAVQKIASELKVFLPVVDLRQLPETVHEAEVVRLAKDEDQTLFDLSEGPLLRVKLLQLTDKQYIVFLSIHHIIIDLQSLEILIRELALFYEAFLNAKPLPLLPNLPIQPADFAYWQHQYLQGEILEKLHAYWEKQLSSVSQPLEFPTDFSRPTTFTFQAAKQSVAISEALSNELRTFISNQKVTLFMTLLTAFQVSLYYYTRQTDVLVVTSMSGRNRIEVENLISLFNNGVVLRTNLSGDPTFIDMLSQVRKVVLDAHAHQDLPFIKQTEILLGEQYLNYMPLLPVVFTLDKFPTKVPNFSGLSNMKFLSFDNKTRSGNDLSLRLLDKSVGLEGALTYNGNLFKYSTIARILFHFQTVLESIIVNPKQRLSEFCSMGDVSTASE